MIFSEEEEYIFAIERFFKNIDENFLNVTYLTVKTNSAKYRLIPQENIYPIFIQIKQEGFGYLQLSAFTWIGKNHTSGLFLKKKNGDIISDNAMVKYIENIFPEAFTENFYKYNFQFNYEEIKKISEAIKLDKELKINDNNINNKLKI